MRSMTWMEFLGVASDTLLGFRSFGLGANMRPFADSSGPWARLCTALF